MIFLPAINPLSRLFKHLGALLNARRPSPGPRGWLEPRRCSRCDHLYLAMFDEPAPQWFALCSRCQRTVRETLLALLLAFFLTGLLTLAIGR